MGAASIRRLRGREREAHAREALERFAESGLNQAAFCREEGISPVTLSRWLGEFGPAESPAASAGFVEVRLDRGGAGGAFELGLSGGRHLRIPAGFDVGDLARLLAVLERAPC